MADILAYFLTATDRFRPPATRLTVAAAVTDADSVRAPPGVLVP